MFTRALTVVKAVVRTKRFWSLVGLIVAAVGGAVFLPVVGIIETVSCTMLGGCVS